MSINLLTGTEKKSQPKAVGGNAFKEMGELFQNRQISGLLLARMLQEIAQGVMTNCWNEILRSGFNLSAQFRGFVGMYMGALTTIVQVSFASFYLTICRVGLLL